MQKPLRRNGELVAADGTEERAGEILAVFRCREVRADLLRRLRGGAPAETLVARVGVEVPHAEPRDRRSASTGLKADGEDRAIAQALKRVLGRRLEDGPRLRRRERRRRALAPVLRRARDVAAGIRADELLLDEMREEGRER